MTANGPTPSAVLEGAPVKPSWLSVKWSKHHKQLGFLAMTALALAGLIIVGARVGWWYGGLAALAVGIVATALPILWSFLASGAERPRSLVHQRRQPGHSGAQAAGPLRAIEGTLRFWKNKATAHYRLHLARVMWSLISSVSLPVLVQRFEKDEPGAVLFMTALTAWTGLISILAYTLKSEEKYQGFRQQESDFYDEGRRLLDFADPRDPKFKERVDGYIRTIDQCEGGPPG